MRHRILTCHNHPELRWSCKDIAWTNKGDGTGYYNGSRNIFFNGTPTGEGMFSDGSGLYCRSIGVRECDCKPSELVLALEDEWVKRFDEDWMEWRKRVKGKIKIAGMVVE